MKKALNRARATEHRIITTNVVHRLGSRETFGAGKGIGFGNGIEGIVVLR
jgi:hypothetical protein